MGRGVTLVSCSRGDRLDWGSSVQGFRRSTGGGRLDTEDSLHGLGRWLS